MKYAAIAEHRATYPVRWMCRQLHVSSSGFYAWSRAPGCARRTRDERLLLHIVASHKASRGVYGSPRLHRALARDGLRVGCKRVARLMRENGLTGIRRRRFTKTTDSSHGLAVADNILDRRFVADAPNRKWVTDITYIATDEGWVYLAAIIDLYSRRVVGFAMAEHMRVELVLQALDRAVSERRPGRGLLHHSDRGSQYASHSYQRALTKHGMVCSMSRRAECWDNCVAESFFGRLKEELVYRKTYATRAQAVADVADYINKFYNARRLQKRLGYVCPIEYEVARERAKVA